MTTTELRNSVRSMSTAEQALALAVSIVMDRILRLTKEDSGDLFDLVKELAVATNDEDRNGIVETMIEILDGRSAKIEKADLSDSARPSERWQKWVDWVSKRIRDARNESSLTQEQLAERTGLPQSHISRIENAKHSPSRATLEKIAAALNKPLEFFDFN